MLSDSQLTLFNTFGFVVLRGFLTADEIDMANAEFDIGLAAAAREMQRAGIRGQLNWSNLRPETPFQAGLLEDPRFVGAAEKILGDRAVGDVLQLQLVRR